MVLGIFTAITDFFNKLFGKKELGHKVYSLNELEDALDDKFSFTERTLTLTSAKLLAEIKFLHARALTTIQDVQKKELEDKTNKRFNKAAFTAKGHIEIQLVRVLENIDPKNRGTTITDARAYTEEAITLLVKEIIHVRKNIAYTSAYLKDEMKALGGTMQELLEKLQELKKALDENKSYFVLEKTKKELHVLRGLEETVIAETKKKDELLNVLTARQSTTEEWKRNIAAFESGEAMSGVKQIEAEKQKLLSEKQSLKTELSSLLATIDKPLQRFSQLVESGRWKISKEEKNILDGFITNPILALKSDPKGITFKKVLTEIVKAVEDEKIDFKEREKEKRLAALNDLIAFDFFDKMFWQMNDLQKKQIELDKRLSSSKAFDELEKLKQKLRESEKSIADHAEDFKQQEFRLASAAQKLADTKTSIEKAASEVLGRTVLLKLD